MHRYWRPTISRHLSVDGGSLYFVLPLQNAQYDVTGGSLLDDADTFHYWLNCCLLLARRHAQRGVAHGNTGKGLPGWHCSQHWAGSLASRCSVGDNAGLVNLSSHVQTGGSQIMNYP